MRLGGHQKRKKSCTIHNSPPTKREIKSVKNSMPEILSYGTSEEDISKGSSAHTTLTAGSKVHIKGLMNFIETKRPII